LLSSFTLLFYQVKCSLRSALTNSSIDLYLKIIVALNESLLKIRSCFVIGINKLLKSSQLTLCGNLSLQVSKSSGISCGLLCSAPFPSGTEVTLTATNAPGSTFTGWSGGGCSGTGTCTVTLTTDTTVTATFIPRVTLTVARAGAGAGTVTSSPAGIDCGATCAATYNQNTTVTLTAAAAPGSAFVGWSGGGCSGTGTCIVTMSAATSVTATFAP